MNSSNEKRYTDLTYLKSVSKGNGAFEQKMLNAFVLQAGTDMKRMKQALVIMDWETIHMIAHKLKPSLQFVGLHEIQPDMHQLESIAKQRSDFDKVTELVAHIAVVMEIAIEEIKEILLSFGKK
ncbi:MAG TPA: Hpt domain-containing protein [Bacteroidia bacterium]|jgi:HPt (histidine-containing phosphotransfer) domain-containing protein